MNKGYFILKYSLYNLFLIFEKFILKFLIEVKIYID
jgi:hypothetical protein